MSDRRGGAALPTILPIFPLTGVLLVPPATSFNNTATMTATIGTQPATVIYSIASPGFVGLYQTAVTVPSGVSGPVPLALSVGGTPANVVTLYVQ